MGLLDRVKDTGGGDVELSEWRSVFLAGIGCGGFLVRDSVRSRILIRHVEMLAARLIRMKERRAFSQHLNQKNKIRKKKTICHQLVPLTGLSNSHFNFHYVFSVARRVCRLF